MKLEWLRADITSARRATTYLAVLLTASLSVQTSQSEQQNSEQS